MYRIFNESMINNTNDFNHYYKTKDNTLIKLCEIIGVDFVERKDGIYGVPVIGKDNAEKLAILENAPYLKGLAGVRSVIKGKNGILGYEIDNFKDKELIRDLRFSDSFNNKKSELMELHKNLRQIHNYITLDNLSIDNVLYTENGLKIINWDNNEYLPLFNQNEKKDDAMKMFLISLYYLYGIDFEAFTNKNGIEELTYLFANKNIDTAAERYLIDTIMYDNLESPIYFDDYLAESHNMSSLKKEYIKKITK